jgi:hypothetical protein
VLLRAAFSGRPVITEGRCSAFTVTLWVSIRFGFQHKVRVLPRLSLLATRARLAAVAMPAHTACLVRAASNRIMKTKRSRSFCSCLQGLREHWVRWHAAQAQRPTPASRERFEDVQTLVNRLAHVSRNEKLIILRRVSSEMLVTLLLSLLCKLFRCSL